MTAVTSASARLPVGRSPTGFLSGAIPGRRYPERRRADTCRQNGPGAAWRCGSCVWRRQRCGNRSCDCLILRPAVSFLRPRVGHLPRPRRSSPCLRMMRAARSIRTTMTGCDRHTAAHPAGAMCCGFCQFREIGKRRPSSELMLRSQKVPADAAIIQNLPFYKKIFILARLIAPERLDLSCG